MIPFIDIAWTLRTGDGYLISGQYDPVNAK